MLSKAIETDDSHKPVTGEVKAAFASGNDFFRPKVFCRSRRQEAFFAPVSGVIWNESIHVNPFSNPGTRDFINK
jgi:hypothetical protein